MFLLAIRCLRELFRLKKNYFSNTNLFINISIKFRRGLPVVPVELVAAGVVERQSPLRQVLAHEPQMFPEQALAQRARHAPARVRLAVHGAVRELLVLGGTRVLIMTIYDCFDEGIMVE